MVCFRKQNKSLMANLENVLDLKIPSRTDLNREVCVSHVQWKLVQWDPDNILIVSRTVLLVYCRIKSVYCENPNSILYNPVSLL